MKLFTKYRLFLQIWSLIFISFLGNPITSYSAFTDRTVEEKMEDMREKARRPLRAESEKIKEQLEREKRERPEDQSHFLSQLTQVISQPTVAEERVSAFQSEGAQAEFWRSLYEQERAKLGRFEEAGEAETERSGGESPATSMFGDTFSFMTEDKTLSGAGKDLPHSRTHTPKHNS